MIMFSTSASDIRERNRQWASATGRRDMLLYDDGIVASIHGGDAGLARICSVSLGKHRIDGHEPDADDGTRGSLKFVFQEQGQCLFEQQRKTLVLEPGEWCVYDKDLPHHIENTGYSVQLALVAPLRMNHGAAHGLMQRFSMREGAGKLLYDMIRSSIAELDRLSATGRHMIGQNLISLARLAIAECTERNGARSTQDALRAQVLGFVDRHLDDPFLDIERIAGALGYSRRYLHRAFAGQDQTLARLIWQRRLESCRADLRGAAMADQTITEIAHRWGFSDSHHFSRMFKAQYGMSPSRYRVGDTARGNAAPD
jgi:AraC-like DNA-binding protein